MKTGQYYLLAGRMKNERKLPENSTAVERVISIAIIVVISIVTPEKRKSYKRGHFRNNK